MESIRTNHPHAIGDRHLSDADLVEECVHRNLSNTFGDNKLGYKLAVKMEICFIGKRVSIIVGKRDITPRRYVRDIYVLKGTTAFKR